MPTMKGRITLMLVLLVFYSSCTKDTPPEEKNLLENNSYAYLFFETEKECMANQPEPDFFHNCHQQIDFYEDNNVEIMLTDILWRGTYKIEDIHVFITLEPNYEIPGGEVVFELINGGAQLLKLDNNTVWKKISGDSIWD